MKNPLRQLARLSQPESKSPEQLEKDETDPKPRRVPKAALCIAVALALVIGPIAAFADYTDSNAGPEFSIGDILGAADTVISELNPFTDLMRGAVNNNIVNTYEALHGITVNGVIKDKLPDVNHEAYEWVKGIHQTVAVPLANVVLIIFLLVGLGKVISHAGRAEAGVDLWALIWVFIAYAFTKVIIDSSWYLMECAYELVRQFIVLTLDDGVHAWSAAPFTVADNVKNTSSLLTMWVVSMLTWGVAALCGLLCNVVVIVRIIQIYVYTALAPISLATLTAEGGRQMATGFLKRYMALLLSGLLMAVLFVLFGLMLQGFGLPEAPTKPDEVAKWSLGMIQSIGWAAAFAWCMFKSGAWARDFVGV